MKKSTIIIASLLCVIGLLICIVGIMAIGFDFSKLNTEKYNERIYDVNEDFENIVIDASIADVNFILCDNKNATVKNYERTDRLYYIYVKDETLYIKENKDVKWYENIRFSFFANGNNETIDVYLPDTEYKNISIDIDTGDVRIPAEFTFDGIEVESDTGDIRVFAKAKNISLSADTGDITAEKFDADNMEIETDTGRINIYNVNMKDNLSVETDTGDVHIADVKVGSLNAESNTGDILFEHTEALGRLSVISDTGDVNFSLSDAGSIYVRTSTGDVRGTLLSQKAFTTYTTTGKVRVPNSNSGGSCEIKTSTGDINIKIENY